MLAQLREKLPDFERAGVSVTCIVQGTTEEAIRLCGRHGMAGRCLDDPSKASYKEMGFPNCRWRDIVLPSAELRRRRKEARAAGCHVSVGGSLMKHSDVMQLGGAALIATNGRILWSYRSVHPGDLPSAGELLNIAADPNAINAGKQTSM